jgi:hypothetical protein
VHYNKHPILSSLQKYVIFLIINSAKAHPFIFLSLHNEYGQGRIEAKQNADVKHAIALRKSIEALEAYYPNHKH